MTTSLNYPKEQMSLIIMDIFKGQCNCVIIDLSKKHTCQSAIVPHNFTNLFQPLDITVNKVVMSLSSNKCNACFSEQVSQQLEKVIQHADFKVSIGLTELKAMNARCIVDLYQYLCCQQEIILNGFKAALRL